MKKTYNEIKEDKSIEIVSINATEFGAIFRYLEENTRLSNHKRKLQACRSVLLNEEKLKNRSNIRDIVKIFLLSRQDFLLIFENFNYDNKKYKVYTTIKQIKNKLNISVEALSKNKIKKDDKYLVSYFDLESKLMYLKYFDKTKKDLTKMELINDIIKSNNFEEFDVGEYTELHAKDIEYIFGVKNHKTQYIKLLDYKIDEKEESYYDLYFNTNLEKIKQKIKDILR